MRARVTNMHISSHQHTMPLHSTPGASITKWLYGATVTKPDLWNPDGNGWQLKNNSLEPAMFERDAARKKFETSHISIASTQTSCSQIRTCQCLNAKLTCTEFCSCNCDECSNRDHSLLLYSDSSDDENY